MLELHLQYKRTSWLTKQSKKHYPLYWTKNVQLLSLIFHSIHPWLSAFWCFLSSSEKMSWEEESGGERLSLSDSEASCKRQHSLSDNQR
uniref:Uncharacterized protein n=1 Tax=Sander lucioperca TaxID=283035 RepID=A0A8D0A9A7_SANLU